MLMLHCLCAGKVISLVAIKFLTQIVNMKLFFLFFSEADEFY